MRSGMEKDQIELMKAYIAEQKQPENEKNLYKQFKSLYELTYEIYRKNLKSTNVGESEENWNRNRYYQREPYDENRVVLDKRNNDYINASYIKNFAGNYSYIAAQGPLENTIHAFTRMLKQFNIKTIICACNAYEDGMEKCFRYWTDLDQKYAPLKDFKVSLKKEPIVRDGYIIRDLSIESKGVSGVLEVRQFHLTNWPDHGVPESIEPIIQMLEDMHGLMDDRDDDKKKIDKIKIDERLVVHCSAGCGRTGTIIAIDKIMNIINEQKIIPNCMYTVANSLREQRTHMIETFEQYKLFAKAIQYLYDKNLQSNDPTHK